MTVFDFYFYIFAAIAVLCSLGLIVARHPITGAVSLIGVMLSLAGIYSLLQAPFLGVIQILVYAGAIMMLVVFVIMVLNGAKDYSVPRYGNPLLLLLLVVPVLFLIFLTNALCDADIALKEATAPEGTVKVLGQTLFNMENDSRGYYVLFEIIGLVLLSSIVGAVFLAKRELALPEAEAEGNA